MRILKSASIILFVVIAAACNNHESQTKIVIYTRAPLNSVLFIKMPGFFTEQEKTIDSAVIKDNHDSLIFYLPKTQERLFKITLKDNNSPPVTFVNDVSLIRFKVDYFADTCDIQNSPASISLKSFSDSQLILSKHMNRYGKRADSLQKLGLYSKLVDSLGKLYKSSLSYFFKRYIGYADTVKSPAGFMAVFNDIEFGDDHEGLKSFILRNSKRFSNYTPIQELKRQTLAAVRIYEQELNIGDALPVVTLPDKNDKLFNTASLKGKYYLVDIWSTWCQPCIMFKNAEYHLYKDNPDNNIQMIGIALDDHVKEWKKFVEQLKHPSIELIDTKMWQGPTAYAMVFDSIPYNFLVNPQGKIIAKAIKPGDLEMVIKRLVKK